MNRPTGRIAEGEFSLFDLVVGLQKQGKTHLARYLATLAATGRHPDIPGIRCRVLVLDPNYEFRSIATSYDSLAAYTRGLEDARRARRAFPAIVRFTYVDEQQLVELAATLAHATGMPSVVVFDEGLTVDAANENYIAPWLKKTNARRRWLGVGFLFLAQDASIHRSLIRSATHVYLFRLVDQLQLRRLQVAATIPDQLLRTVPQLAPRTFRHGVPGQPESWR